ncbi:MAG: IscS subfamily cysteine desulfurase [Planctomycetaceae bacterium]|nr:IscS subfamily cysteine desulfurase [Planctomycetaceae bacterium]
MVVKPVYMDNHATTRVDPRVLERMLPLFNEFYGNPGSVNHVFGWDAQEQVKLARESIATLLNANPNEIVFTSGATESNNLAIRGVAERKRRKGNHVISVKTEHHAILDPLERLRRGSYEVTLLTVDQKGTPTAGRLDPNLLNDAIRPDTCLVSVMLANNEIGVIHDLRVIGDICRQAQVLLHCDATQALGRVALDVEAMKIDLLSLSAHKFYGPKGIGALYVRKTRPGVRLEPLMTGGGQEQGIRSGTLNPPAIVGMASALEIAVHEMESENNRLRTMRDLLYSRLSSEIDDVILNGPGLEMKELRLPNNLNVSFSNVDGEALMMSMRELAVSSGSACSSTNPEPSHVLRALGIADDTIRASLRFGLGRFNTLDEVDFAVDIVKRSVKRLRAFKER